MSVADVLNTDIGQVLPGLRRAVRWWMDELAAIVAPRPSSRVTAPPAVLAEPDGAGAYLIQTAEGERWRHAPGDRRLTAALLLAPDQALVRPLAMPPLAERDLRRMVELDLDRLTPFAAAEVFYEVRAIGPADDTGQLPTRLVAAPKAEVAQALEAAAAAGLAVEALLVDCGDGEACDLLPRATAAVGRDWTRSPAARAWGVVAALAAANLALAVWKDVAQTDRVQAAAAQQQPVVDRIERLRRRTLAAQALEASQRALRDRGEPLRVLDALSRDLPAQAWLSRLTLENGRVHLVGQQVGGGDPAEALRRDPLFSDVHGEAGETLGAGQALDLSATVAAPPNAAQAPPAAPLPGARTAP